LRINPERTWAQEEIRLQDVEEQNRKLFKKIKNINSVHHKHFAESEFKEHHSMTGRIQNRSKRISEMQRENSYILNRLQDVKSNYNCAQWRSERQKIEKIL
jgi:hypothetical protein